jgi:hypothetical protein
VNFHTRKPARGNGKGIERPEPARDPVTRIADAGAHDDGNRPAKYPSRSNAGR